MYQLNNLPMRGLKRNNNRSGKLVYQFINTSVYLLIFLLLSSCAQVVAPGGGKKDVKPPRALKYVPDSAQVGFNTKSVQITFDEFIQLKDLNNQLIISPPVKTTPEFTIKNKTLTITFDKKDTLKPNTTYSISFGNAVQDITENNPIENYKYIFSTGTFIDSAVVKGKVENGFNHTTEKGILVNLYSKFNDSTVYKSLPDYFAKTKEDGTFQINNIKAANYKLVAIKDGNSNYKYDGEAESIGFMDALVDVTEKKSILIDMFQETPKKLYLKKATYDSYGKIVFVFNKGADSLTVNPINYTFKNYEDVALDYSAKKDTLTYWFKNIDLDALKLQLKDGNRIMDTLEYKLIVKEDALKAKRNKLKLSLTNNFNGNQSFDLNGEIKMVFNHPLESNPYAKVDFKEDSTLYKSTGSLEFFLEGKNKMKVIYWDSASSNKEKDNSGTWINAPTIKSPLLKESTKYHLFVPPGTFTDFFGLTNDSIKIDFKTQEEKFYGSVKLKLNVRESKEQYIVQLLDERENIVRENIVKAGETIDYPYLHPMQYKLKLIYDDNNNGKWDTGNYINKQQPEKVIYYSGAINIRSNWDQDLEWKVEP